MLWRKKKKRHFKSLILWAVTHPGYPSPLNQVTQVATLLSTSVSEAALYHSALQ